MKWKILFIIYYYFFYYFFLGILGTVTVDNNEVRKWKISSLDFEETWTKR